MNRNTFGRDRVYLLNPGGSIRRSMTRKAYDSAGIAGVACIVVETTGRKSYIHAEHCATNVTSLDDVAYAFECDCEVSMVPESA